MASTGTGLACALLCSGLSWAANPCGSPQGDGAGAQQSQVDWELPAIDAEVAGRLARMCEESRRGSSRAVQEQVLGLQQRPERLALCLATTLEHGAWRVPGDGGEPVSTWRVTGEREALLLELASGLPATLVVERARLALAAEVTPRQRRAELMLLGQVARPQDVPLIFDLAQACDMLRARGDFERALGRTLQRDAAGCREVEGRWRSLPGELRVSALRGLAASEQPEALPILAARLDDQPDLTLVALSLVGSLAARLPVEVDAHSAERVRAHLDSTNPQVRREAALAAGRIEDAGSAERLVEMLAGEPSAEREAAYWALRQISQLGLPASELPWRLWLAGEQQWWNKDWPGRRADLSSGSPSRVTAALESLASQRLYRAEMARAISASAGRGTSEYDELRCHALGALRTRAGLPFLAECLASPDEAVRKAAGAAWQARTGQPPPASGPAWSANPR